MPSDIIKASSTESPHHTPRAAPRKKSKQPIKTVLPKNLRVVFGCERLVDIRGELTMLKRETFPNAAAIMLRVFFELTVQDYLERIGEMKGIIKKLEGRQGGNKLPFGTPTMRQLVPEILRIAKQRLTASQLKLVMTAVKYDPAAPFTISNLHAFVHSSDLPSERDSLQFWNRTEPLFRMMLEQDPEDAEE